MILLTWNMRGLVQDSRQSALFSLLHIHKVDVLGLVETKLSPDSLKKFISKYFKNWSYTENFDLVKGGRILIIWNPLRVEMNDIVKEEQVIHSSITCRLTNNSFKFSVVYGFWHVADRRSLWDSLLTNVPLDFPALVAGDFNCVLDPSERIGDRTLPEREYRDFVDTCAFLSLADCPSTGCFYTWTNLSRYSKIDRVLTNNAWLEKNWFCRTNFLPRGAHSDHSPVITSLFDQVARYKRPFKFYNAWMKHTKFEPALEENWAGQLSVQAQLNLSLKLERLQKALNELNLKEFVLLSEKATAAREQLAQCQEKMDLHPRDEAVKLEELEIRKNVLFLDKIEREFYAQRAKSRHLNLADKNTKFFHDIVKRNNARNTISFLCRPDGELTYEPTAIIRDLTEFYSNLFGVEKRTQPIDRSIIESGYCLNCDENKCLVRPITDVEIMKAIWDIASEKAPGPDGYPSEFFKANWDVVGADVIAAVREFFEKGLILRKLNHTTITLIPKKSHNPTVADFRPIACTNVVYKTITKILAKRLDPMLSNLINSAQSAFTKGRNITDNIFLAQELIRKYERKRISPRCMLKIDLQKAYDTISWNFLREVLLGLNFHPQFVFWIMTCVTCPTFSIAVNGGLHGNIVGKRGLRQGDPMSPALFLLCIEYFSRLTNVRTKELEFNFHPKCGKENITHLAFADDLLLFGRGDTHSMGVLACILNEFSEASGLQINASKSQIFMAGVDLQSKKEIVDMFGFQLGALPVKYLGLPLAAKKLNIQDYSPLIDQVSSFIKRWSNSNLSMAGKIELARSVLQGVECYWIQTLPLPVTIIDRINALIRRFVWGSSACPVAWKDICKPKTEGGLDLRDLAAWNKALLAKTLWNIHAKEDSLWIRWVHSEFIKDRDLWSITPNHCDSPTFKNILGIRDILLAGCNNDKYTVIRMLEDWKASKFSTAAYEHFRPKGEKKFWHKAIWKSFVPPRFSFTTWLALRGRLKTVDRIKHITVCKSCCLCNSAPESHEHLFFKCGATIAVWDKIRMWLKLSRRMTTIPSAIKHFHRSRRGSPIVQKAKLVALTATVNILWFARNKLIFEDEPFDVKSIVSNIKKDTYTCLYNLFPPDKVMEHMEAATFNFRST